MPATSLLGAKSMSLDQSGFQVAKSPQSVVRDSERALFVIGCKSSFSSREACEEGESGVVRACCKRSRNTTVGTVHSIPSCYNLSLVSLLIGFRCIGGVFGGILGQPSLLRLAEIGNDQGRSTIIGDGVDERVARDWTVAVLQEA